MIDIPYEKFQELLKIGEANGIVIPELNRLAREHGGRVFLTSSDKVDGIFKINLKEDAWTIAEDYNEFHLIALKKGLKFYSLVSKIVKELNSEDFVYDVEDELIDKELRIVDRKINDFINENYDLCDYNISDIHEVEAKLIKDDKMYDCLVDLECDEIYNFDIEVDGSEKLLLLDDTYNVYYEERLFFIR